MTINSHCVGCNVGDTEGLEDGAIVGCIVGLREGVLEGAKRKKEKRGLQYVRPKIPKK